MYIHSVKLVNFKSIGDYPECEIILEPNITAIIGKNESGKSNILDGLSRINFIKPNGEAFSPYIVNRSSASGTQNKYIITLKPQSNEKLTKETVVEITNNECNVTGELFEYYLDNIYPKVEEMISILDKGNGNPMNLANQDLTFYNSYMQDFLQKQKLDLYCISKALDFYYSRRSKLPIDLRENFETAIKGVRDLWSDLLQMFPTIFYRKADKHLNTSYKLEEVEKELKTPGINQNSLLSDFVKLVGVPIEDFITAVRSGGTPIQEKLRRRINNLVNEKINKPFCEFYQTEVIKLDLGFNAGVVNFVVQSGNGEALMLSERSNGLKWYLETFIDSQSKNVASRNVVYLFDEPGISLHVNAQREVLSLFRHLSERGNQVVYSTHSPYMLDVGRNGIHRIRAVVKNVEGFTNIYKTAYDLRISAENQNDTLTPIIFALGMNLNDTFGPAKDKLNIVTEGVSDYIYLSTMAKLLGIDSSRYVILPAVGASNCINICCILHGWGCPYIALFDYDKEGVKSGESLRKNFLFEYKKQYCYIADVSQIEVDNGTYISDPCTIEDLVTNEEISRYCNITKSSNTVGKTLIAKLISNAIESGSYQLGETCITNFKELFERLFSYYDNSLN